VETNLIDLHHHCHPFLKKWATHQQGSHPIDLMAGSPLLTNALLHAWMCPFNDPAMVKGNHHLLGLDFGPEICFRTKTMGIVITGQQKVKADKFKQFPNIARE